MFLKKHIAGKKIFNGDNILGHHTRGIKKTIYEVSTAFPSWQKFLFTEGKRVIVSQFVTV